MFNLENYNLLDIIGIFLIIMKLAGVIKWSWWYIFLPLYGQLIFVALYVIIGMIIRLVRK